VVLGLLLSKPLTYAYILDKIIHGSMPLMHYLTNMVELAIDLTECIGNKQQKRLISHMSAKNSFKSYERNNINNN
jgi:hypothetical protein